MQEIQAKEHYSTTLETTISHIKHELQKKKKEMDCKLIFLELIIIFIINKLFCSS